VGWNRRRFLDQARSSSVRGADRIAATIILTAKSGADARGKALGRSAVPPAAGRVFTSPGRTSRRVLVATAERQAKRDFEPAAAQRRAVDRGDNRFGEFSISISTS